MAAGLLAAPLAIEAQQSTVTLLGLTAPQIGARHG
jgi:hypothetical protein